MKAWPKNKERDADASSIAQFALLGAGSEELLQAAKTQLGGLPTVDRVGVWLTAIRNSGSPTHHGLLRGEIWDRENIGTPLEWNKISPGGLLTQEFLSGGKTLVQDLDISSNSTFIGPLVGLRQILWVPVQREGRLRGIFMLGTRKKNAELPTKRAENIAAELALALEFKEQQQLAREHQDDAQLAKNILAQMEASNDFASALEKLAINATQISAAEGAQEILFAAVGRLADFAMANTPGPSLSFRWKSGDSSWLNALDSEPIASVWHKALETHSIAGSELSVSWAHGEIVRVVALPLDASGALQGVFVAGLRPGGLSLAVLERLEIRAALAASALAMLRRGELEEENHSWQALLLNASGSVMLLLNQQGEIVQLSHSARAMLGESAKEFRVESTKQNSAIRGTPFSQIFCAREQSRVNNWIERALRGQNQSHNVDKHFLEAELSNGVRVRIHPPSPAGGALAAIELTRARSLSEGKHRDRAEVELHSVIEWLEEGVVLFDDKENVRAMNTRFAQIAGLPARETEAHVTFENLVTHLSEQVAEPKLFRDRWKALAENLESGVRDEIAMSRPTVRVLERAARPVLDEVGRRVGRVEIYRDLTAHRLFQAKLLQTEKLAALGQTLTGVAHELSNPLTTILGYAQRLLLQKESNHSLPELRQIVQEAERAGTILRQLLFSARESTPERRQVSLNQVIHRALDIQRFSMSASNISIEEDLDPLLPFVQGDAGQLQQVLMNLIGNARQAIDQPLSKQTTSGVIRLTTKRMSEQRVLLEVADSGPGIPTAIQARIFDPFFTTKPPGEGTGLGLAIVLSIVREHGGTVHVSSPPSGGVVFSVELPAASIHSQTEKKKNSVTDQSPAVQPPRNSRASEHGSSSLLSRGVLLSGRVLVVEDEPTVARLIADVLVDNGFAAEVLLDGRQAVTRVSRQSYDLIICDMRMPGLDGQTFYKTLQRSAIHLPKPFLFVTGDVLSLHTREFLENNHIHHVAKPFRIEELSDKVWEILDRNRLQEISLGVSVKRNVAGNG